MSVQNLTFVPAWDREFLVTKLRLVMPVRETPFRGAWQRDGIQARRLRAIAKRSFAEGVPKPEFEGVLGFS